MSKSIMAWHFLPENGRMRFGRWPRPVRAGVTYVHRGPLVLCESGLHACVQSLDAISHAPGPIVCRVRCGGRIEHALDKLACSRRRVIWLADATRELHEFALWCAERALARVPDPDPRSIEALRVKRAWLDSQATDMDLERARLAAYAAAHTAAYASAHTVAYASAYDAAYASAHAAAHTAAYASAHTAAYASAYDAAYAAEREAQDAELTRRLMSLTERT